MALWQWAQHASAAAAHQARRWALALSGPRRHVGAPPSAALTSSVGTTGPMLLTNAGPKLGRGRRHPGAPEILAELLNSLCRALGCCGCRENTTAEAATEARQMPVAVTMGKCPPAPHSHRQAGNLKPPYVASALPYTRQLLQAAQQGVLLSGTVQSIQAAAGWAPAQLVAHH